MSEKTLPQDPSRREAMKTALKVGAYAAPVIVAVTMPTPVSAQVSGQTGILTGLVTNALNAQPIAGATVSKGSASAITNASGIYTIAAAPAGAGTLTTSASGFTTRTDSVNVIAGTTTTFNTSLVPTSAGSGVTIVLTWGAVPSDLDSHLVGPNGSGGRFHCYYSNKNPVSFVSLDVDDTSAFGPETITVSKVAGSYIAGSYSYYVHNYSGSPYFDVSNAVVTVFVGGTQVGQYLVASGTGSPSSPYWAVVEFTLTPDGSGNVFTPLLNFTSIAPMLGAVMPPKGQ